MSMTTNASVRDNRYDPLKQITHITCNSMSKVARRLEMVRPHIRDLEISIWIEDLPSERDKSLAAAQAVLQPFQRLRSISNARVRSVVCSDYHNLRTVLFPNPNNLKTEADLEFESYAKCWENEVSSCEPVPEASVVSAASQQLDKVLYTIRSQQGLCFSEDAKTFHSILSAAESAHEAEDFAVLKDAWRQAMSIWCDYLNEQDRRRKNVVREIDLFNRMISGESNDPSLQYSAQMVERSEDRAGNSHSQERLDDALDMNEPGDTYFECGATNLDFDFSQQLLDCSSGASI
jgi:hypothetical protein